jgi:copper transport protein
MGTAHPAPTWQRRGVTLLVTLLAVFWLTLHPTIAFAHAEDDHSSPAPGAVLSTAPMRVDIWFTEHLTPTVSTIQVYDAERHRVDRNDTQIDPSNTLHMGVTLPPLPSGLYTVVWANVSADDGHANRGGFAFTILLPTATPAPKAAAVVGGPPSAATAQPTAMPTTPPLPSQSAQEIADLLNPATDRPTAAVDLAGGWLTFSASILAGGGALFALLCLLPALAQLGPEGRPLAMRLQRRFAWLTLLCALIGALAAFVSLLAKAEIATGLPPTDLLSSAVLEPLLQVWSGQVWIFREAAFACMAVAAGAAILLGARRAVAAPVAGDSTAPRTWGAGPGQRLLLVVTVVLGGAGLLFQALDSHLAAGHVARQGPLATADLTLHLLAVGAWVGGLGYAALLLWPVWRTLPDEARAAIATVAITRFSPLALASVLVITVTGTYAAILLLPTPTDLLTSAYGQALDVKLALLLVLILFGAANRRTLARLARSRQCVPLESVSTGMVPRFSGGHGRPTPLNLGPTIGHAGRRLLRAMRLEFMVASVVLLAAGTMLEVGPPGVALAAEAVQLDGVVTLAALPVSAPPVPATPTPHPTPAPSGYSHTETAGDLMLALTVDPAVAGAKSAFQVQVHGKDGTATSNAEVKLRLTAQAIDLGTQVLTAAAAGPGVYRVTAPALAVPGPWEIILNVRRDNVPEVDTTFTVPVGAPAPPPAPTTPAATPPAQPTATPDTLHATLAFQPDVPAVGIAQATLHLARAEGAPVPDAQVQAMWLMPQHAHLTQSALLPAGLPGDYASAVDLSMAGAWLADVTLTLPDGRSARLQFTFNVRDRGLFGSIGTTTVAMAAVPVRRGYGELVTVTR